MYIIPAAFGWAGSNGSSDWRAYPHKRTIETFIVTAHVHIIVVSYTARQVKGQSS